MPTKIITFSRILSLLSLQALDIIDKRANALPYSRYINLKYVRYNQSSTR